MNGARRRARGSLAALTPSTRAGALALGALALVLAAGCSRLGGDDDPGGTCTYGGRTYPFGATFKDTDGCNSCWCDSKGVACTLMACLPDGGGSDVGTWPPDAGTSDGGAAWTDGGSDALGCTFAGQTYEFWDDGGMRLRYDRSTLGPDREHTIASVVATGSGDVQTVCSRLLPCEGGRGVPDVLQALRHPDVVAALAQPVPPHYGNDPRPVDGTVFMFRTADGRGFSLGSDTVPQGLRSLEQLLHLLLEESLTSVQCGVWP